MPDLETFEAEVKAKIKQLSSKDPDTRRKAASWLGEAGDPTAITGLLAAYKNDPDLKVREAARYSLGMFRRLETELKGKNRQRVVKLLEDVALKGKMGRRLRVSVRTLVKWEVGLLLAAAVVVGLSFVLPDVLRQLGQPGPASEQPLVAPTAVSSVALPGDRDRATIVNDLRSSLERVTNNTSRLQSQYQSVLGGGSLDCATSFDALSPTTLSENNAASFPELNAVAAQIQNAQDAYAAARGVFDRVCSGGEQIPASDYGAPMSAVLAVIQSIAPIQDALAAASAEPTIEPTAAPTATPDTSATATFTAQSSGLRAHLINLQTLIDNMTAPRGAATLLNQYWTEAQGPTGTAGCGSPVSPADIPADYALPIEDAQREPSLKLAVDLINQGLKALRDGRQLFATACAADPRAYAASGLQLTQAAQTAFDGAGRLITELRGR